MLHDSVPNIIHGSDQAWYQRYFLTHQDQVLLDTGCILLCAISGITPEHGAELRDDRIRVPETGNTPALVHFVGVSHRTQWKTGQPTSTLHRVFQQLFPEAAHNLVDKWW